MCPKCFGQISESSGRAVLLLVMRYYKLNESMKRGGSDNAVLHVRRSGLFPAVSSERPKARSGEKSGSIWLCNGSVIFRNPS